MSQEKKDLLNTVNSNIKYILEREGLTYCKLAKKCGFNRMVLYHLKNKDAMPTLITMVKIADALEITLDYLVTPHAFNKKQ